MTQEHWQIINLVIESTPVLVSMLSQLERYSNCFASSLLHRRCRLQGPIHQDFAASFIMRLRILCSNACVMLARDLDDEYAHFYFKDILILSSGLYDKSRRLCVCRRRIVAVVQALFSELRWDPTAVPLHNILCLLSQLAFRVLTTEGTSRYSAFSLFLDQTNH
jgi:hypothetical protein